jgi:hypothetical protein
MDQPKATAAQTGLTPRRARGMVSRPDTYGSTALIAMERASRLAADTPAARRLLTARGPHHAR